MKKMFMAVLFLFVFVYAMAAGVFFLYNFSCPRKKRGEICWGAEYS
ncbi:hypothetical protein [Escherichia coli]|nr:hypothetical protein [Escherichia coli]